MQHGDAFTLRLLGQRMTFVFAPATLCHYFTAPDTQLTFAPAVQQARTLTGSASLLPASMHSLSSLQHIQQSISASEWPNCLPACLPARSSPIACLACRPATSTAATCTCCRQAAIVSSSPAVLQPPLLIWGTCNYAGYLTCRRNKYNVSLSPACLFILQTLQHELVPAELPRHTARLLHLLLARLRCWPAAGQLDLVAEL